MNLLQKIIHFIASRGVSDRFPEEKEMTRLLNLAAFYTALGAFCLFLFVLLAKQDTVYMSLSAMISIVYIMIPILHHFGLVKTVRYYFSAILPFWYFITIMCIGGFWSQSLATAAIMSVTYVLFEKQKKTRNYLMVHNVLLFILPCVYLVFYPPIFGIRDLPFDEVIIFSICSIWASLVFTHHERQKSDLIERLEEKNKVLEATKEELERFNQIASHDLKAPLRTIIGFTGLIERNIQKGKIEQGLKDLDFVKNSAKQMNVLVEDILEISRLNNNQEDSKTLVDFNVLMKRVEANLLGDILAKNATITVEELPAYFCNEVAFLLLFQNLIQNGLKYNQAEKPCINIWAETNQEIVSLNFKDNGIGIEKEYYDKIFDHFKRLHAQGEYSGTGLGLALCKKVVEKHNGQIRVASVIGQGTTFSIDLPVLKQQEQDKKQRSDFSAKENRNPKTKTKTNPQKEAELVGIKAK